MTDLIARVGPPLVAAVLAGFICYLDLVRVFGRTPSRAALPWVLLKVVIEGGAGAVMYPLLISAFKGLEWFVGAWPIVLAGLCGPALLRAQLALLGSGQEDRHLGPAVGYRYIQQTIGLQISIADADEVRRWINGTVLPSLDQTPSELREDARFYFESRSDVSPKAARAILGQMDAVLADANFDDVWKMKAILNLILAHQGKQYVMSLVTASGSEAFPR